MAIATDSSKFSQESQIWDELKHAIAASSGFQRWRLEKQQRGQLQEIEIDRQVSLYLRETLETLAY